MGFRITKFHGLLHMVDFYIECYGATMNCFGGGPEALHKGAVKQPTLRTTRQHCRFTLDLANRSFEKVS